MALLQATDDARFASFTGTPHLVVWIEGRQRTDTCQYELGRVLIVWSCE